MEIFVINMPCVVCNLRCFLGGSVDGFGTGPYVETRTFVILSTTSESYGEEQP